MEARWRITLLGGLRAEHGGQVVTHFRTQKTAALLAYLAYHLPRSHPRDLLIELLWPEADREAGSNSLSTALSSLRHLLEGPGLPSGAVLVTDRASVRLNPEAVSTDLAEFEAALHAAAAGSDVERREGLARAVTLYRGELLAGSYESWVLGQREWLAETYFQALGRLVTLLEGEGDLPRALEYARQGVLADPLREEARRDLMRLYAAAGQPEAALRQYRELQRLLKEELAAQPSAPTRALARQIEVSPGALVAPSPRSSSAQAPPASPRPLPLREAPSGTRTFLLTDVEGSTSLWEEHPQAMAAALARHDALAATIVAEHAGTLIKHRGEGDSLFAVFAGAGDGVAAALALQRALGAERWPEAISLQVRMALHTGDAVAREGDYLGAAVNRCARLRAAAHGGQVLLSRATQELVAEQLPEGVSLRDLGECYLRDLVRPERLYQLLHPGLPADFPPLQTLATRPNNLPAQPTLLIGREVELEAVRRLLRREGVRLVTLTGAGGSGKTRLGLQIAAELLEEFADGVFFVNLAPIRDAELVAATIAQALGVREVEGRPLGETLKEYLREKQLLLLLDNFEQVLMAAPVVAELLASCPRLKALVTSRAVLRLRGEHDFPVSPLALPDPRRLPPLADLSRYAAVELFLQQARAARPEFAITEENAAVVAQICCRLDGLPLAIELAAARIRILPPQALLSRLENRLGLLTGGARDLPERQQSLRETIAWSYDLLEEPAKILFRRLPVFVGGFTLPAAEAVCRVEGEPEMDVLAGVASLVDQNLLRQLSGEAKEPRFGMLETVQEYARERLAKSMEAELLRQRHTAYILQLAEQAKPELIGRDQPAWLDRFDREHDNLRAALDWAVETGEAEAGLRLASAVFQFWLIRCYRAEGLERLVRLLVLPRAAGRTTVRAEALVCAGRLAGQQGNLTAARAFIAEGLAIWREHDDKAGIADALAALGLVSQIQGDWGAARSLREQSLALQRELGDKWAIASSLSLLGLVALEQGDVEGAQSLFAESLVLCRELGEKVSIARSLHGLGRVAEFRAEWEMARSLYEEGLGIERQVGDKGTTIVLLDGLGSVAQHQSDWESARSFYERSLMLAREGGSPLSIARSLNHLGSLARAQGDHELALSHSRQSLMLFRDAGHQGGIAAGLEEVGALAGAKGQPERAARLLGAAEVLREATHTPLWPAQRARLEQEVAAARAALGEEAFAAAWAAGRALTIEQAVAEALNQEAHPPSLPEDPT